MLVVPASPHGDDMSHNTVSIFREEALQRYGDACQEVEPLRDVSSSVLITLWACTGLLCAAILAVAICVANLIQ